MKKIYALMLSLGFLLVMASSSSFSDERASASSLPWDRWLADFVIVTPKPTYIHVLWDPTPAKENIVPGEEGRIFGTFVQKLLASSRLAPTGPDLVKLDIAYITSRDAYQLPIWSSLKRVAHLSFSRKKIAESLNAGETPESPEFRSNFSEFSVLK